MEWQRELTRFTHAVLVALIILVITTQTIMSTPPPTTIALTTPTNVTQEQTSKIESSLERILDEQQTVDVLIKYDPQVGEAKVRATVAQLDSLADFITSFESLGMLRVKTTPSTIRHLVREAFIQKIWSNEMREIDTSIGTSSHENSIATTTTSLNDYTPLPDLIGARALWERGYNGSGIVVAVLDTGIDFLHDDLNDLDDNSNTTDSKVTAFASFVEGDSLPIDIIGHGTYAASIVGGTGASSSGIYSGVAPGVTLLAAKVTLGGLFAVPSWIVSGIEWACSRGADIILLPFNTLGTPGDAVSDAVRYATEKGVLVIAAAGDDGPDYFTIMSPGGSTAALTIGGYDLTRGVVPAFSGRGPTFELMTKPDIVAPAVGIVGARAGAALESLGFGDFDLESLSGLTDLLGGSLGTPIDDYYIVADTTTAAASIVAGAAAILMQAFDRASPIVISNVLRDTATSVAYGANDAGAGLLNLPRAFEYLSRIQTPVESKQRTTGVPLLALGLVSSQGRSANTTTLMSSFGTMVAALDQRGVEDSGIHLLMGMFSLRWNDKDPTSLMFFDVKRELHQTYLPVGLDNYNRYVGVLAYENEIYVVFLVESYNTNNPLAIPISTGFRITPFILNLGTRPIYNLSLYLSYTLDIYADGKDDHGRYAANTNMLFAYGISEELGDFYIGINSNRTIAAFEVGNASTVSQHVTEDSLTGSTSFDGQVGLGMKWDLGVLLPEQQANLTLAMAFAENRTVLDSMIQTLWSTGPSFTMSQSGDLIVVEADIPRIARMGVNYRSRCVVMNIGTRATSIVAAMVVGRTESDTGSVAANFFVYNDVAPFHAIVLETEWSPERENMYTIAWVVATGVAEALALFTTPSAELAATSIRLLDDFLMRDLFVITPISSVSVFPKHLPFAPFNLRFPVDFGMYGLILSTTVPLGNLTVEKYGDAGKWGNITLTPTENVYGIYNFSLLLFVPMITMDGNHQCDYVLHTDVGWSANITMETTIIYPRAMMLLDTSHGGGLMSSLGGSGGMGGGIGGGAGGGVFPLAQESDTTGLGTSFTDIDISGLDQLSDMLETLRMTTYSGLSTMKSVMAQQRLDLVEAPGMGLTKDILTQFSTVFIISPTKEFNSTEIDTLREFSAGGGRLVILGDRESRANITALNSLLQPYGYQLYGEHDADNTTEIISSSRLSYNIDTIWLDGGTFILNNESMAAVLLDSKTVILFDSSKPELVIFGSSRVFTNTNLMRCDNTVLLDNLNEILLSNTLTAVTSLAENTTRYPVGSSVYLKIELHDYYGRPANDLFVAIAYELPNGSIAYFFAGFVMDGLYSSQFMPSYYRSAGRINGVFIVLRNAEYAGTFASVSFELYVPTPPNATDTGGSALSMPQIAMLASSTTFGTLSIIVLWHRSRRGKRLRIPEVDKELMYAIDNSMNMLMAVSVQIEELVRNEQLDRLEKVEAMRSLIRAIDNAKKKFEIVSANVGGV